MIDWRKILDYAKEMGRDGCRNRKIQNKIERNGIKSGKLI